MEEEGRKVDFGQERAGRREKENDNFIQRDRERLMKGDRRRRRG